MLLFFDYFCQQEFKISTKITFVFHFEGFKLFFPFHFAFSCRDVFSVGASGRCFPGRNDGG